MLVLGGFESYLLVSVFLLLFTQKTNQNKNRYSLLKLLNTPPPQVHHELTYCHNYTGGEGKKRIKTKIGVGSVVKAKVGDMEENTSEGRSRSISKEVEGCFQDLVGKNILLFQFVDGKKKDMSSSSVVFLYSKEEVDMDEPLSNSPEKGQGGFLIIDGDYNVGEPLMFVIGVCLSLFYCLCCVR